MTENTNGVGDIDAALRALCKRLVRVAADDGHTLDDGSSGVLKCAQAYATLADARAKLIEQQPQGAYGRTPWGDIGQARR